MTLEIPNPFEDGTCFFCGPVNQSGLKLKFFRETDSDEVFAAYTTEARFCGQGNVFHGGIQMGLLDEAMWWAGYAGTGIMEAVTVNATFRFLRPVYINDQIRITCRMKSHEGANITLAGRILNSAGKVCTTVSGTYRILNREQYDRLVSAGA